jgi:hypothetical protein
MANAKLPDIAEALQKRAVKYVSFAWRDCYASMYRIVDLFRLGVRAGGITL